MILKNLLLPFIALATTPFVANAGVVYNWVNLPPTNPSSSTLTILNGAKIIVSDATFLAAQSSAQRFGETNQSSPNRVSGPSMFSTSNDVNATVSIIANPPRNRLSLQEANILCPTIVDESAPGGGATGKCQFDYAGSSAVAFVGRLDILFGWGRPFTGSGFSNFQLDGLTLTAVGGSGNPDYGGYYLTTSSNPGGTYGVINDGGNTGATPGYWALDRSTLPVGSVPEPRSLLLVSLGALLIGSMRKRGLSRPRSIK